MPRTKYKRRPAEIERDQTNIARLYLSGMLQPQIAIELKISQATVSRGLKIIQEEWKQQCIYDIDEQKQKELAKIDNLELTYWDAWRRSVGEHTVTTEREGKFSSTETRTEFDVGEKAYLDGVQWCIEARLRIFGIEAPKKSEVHIENLESALVQARAAQIYGNTGS